ncbi:PREDICTED: U3 small nucleolar ribonucleoprotein protein MPP10 [Nanorana parkeri]|uniref:U3 small nucleolar ribonucleoprotein protein MPP10 n=1 Tax=Nanorana parkeri TaxID=125878 RepID=UPI000854C23D|nr:PREDICTED: U3 small nucleolar ribonucleoprotein protein MPP10 [Nanorana parkeri]
MAEVSRQSLWRSTEVLEAVSAHPEQLLSVQEGLACELSNLTKALYDFHRSEAARGIGSPLNELFIENFDEEQIWQQLELQNSAVVSHFKKAISKTVKDKDLYILQVSEEEEEEEEEENAEEEETENANDEEEPEPIPDNRDSKGRNGRLSDNKKAKKSKVIENFSDDDDSDIDFDIDELEKRKKKITIKKPLRQPVEKSIVDDQFFKLSEMEAFLEAAEKEDGKDNEDDEEEVDYFEDVASDLDDDEDEEEFQIGKTRKQITTSARDLQYEDYFDPVEGDETKTDRQIRGEEENERSDDDKEEDGEEHGDEEEEDMEEASELDDYDEGDMMEETEESKKAKKAFKRVTFDLSDGSEGEDVADILGGKKNEEKPQELKSSFEKREDKMGEKIQTLHKQMLEEKSWQLSGEVTSQKRPENSLLSESLVFDHASRMAPTVTEETTLQLEDIIKQRIKDQVWDDVVHKEKPKEDAFEYKKRLTLDHDKSKLSLAEIYEQEFLKLNQKKVEEEENPKHVEIQKLMDSLFMKLDALSNFQFTPKPPVPEMKVVSNLPAISMEEVAPVGVSEAALLAPEEIKEKNKAGDIKTNAEKTASDKKRERRKKKTVKKFKIKEKEKRQKLAEEQRAEKGKKPTKEAAEANIKKLTKEGKATVLKDEGKDKALKSSQAFFSQLQDQVRSQIKSAKSAHKKPKKSNQLSAHKLKL